MTFKLNPEEQYMFATDLDGTFLSEHDGSFHILNYLAVKKLKEAGHKFVITTGRSWWWTQKIYNQLNSIDAAIHFSGAQVHHPHDQNFKSYSLTIPQQTVKDILTHNNLFEYAKKIRVVGAAKHGELDKQEYVDLIDFDALEFIILLHNDSTEKQKANEKMFNDFTEKFTEYTLRFWRNTTHDEIVFSPKGTDKWKSLEYVAKHYGIKQENVIYFGDNTNDLGALEWAGYSYVPLNAKNAAKEKANEIIPMTNEEAAVANQILKLLEQEK